MLLSLHSYYFHDFGAPLFPVLGMLFSFSFVSYLALFSRKRLVDTLANSFFPLAFVFVLLFLGLISALFTEADLIWSRFPALLLFACLVVHFCYLKTYRPAHLETALKWCLITHLCFFWFQVLSHYLGFGFFDFLEPITGESQRVFGGNYNVPITGQRLIRAAGLYSEPGTFATFLFLIYLTYKSIYCANREGKGGGIGRFDLLVITSIVCSFSIFGFVFVFLYLLFSLFIAWRKFILLSPVLVSFALLVFDTYIYPRFFGGISTDTGLGFRSEGMLIYSERVSETPYLIFFGSGFFSDYSIYSPSIVWNDLGLFFSLLMLVGLVGVGAIFFMFCLVLGKLKFYDFLLIIVLCLSKISLSMALFWIVLSTAFGKKAIFNKMD